MSRPTIAIASDHAGYELKALLADELRTMEYDVMDLGTDSTESVDYPDFADKLAAAISDGKAAQGVLICGSGVGISMAANRHKGVRAAACYDATTARLAREHNDANVLALGARLIGSELALDCLRAFLKTKFKGGRHQRRVKKMG